MSTTQGNWGKWIEGKLYALNHPKVLALQRTSPAPQPTTVAKRIRQSSKPLNKLEQEFLEYLKAQHNGIPSLRPQALRFQLANGVTLTPDIISMSWPLSGGDKQPTAWEVKGPFAWEDSLIKLKFAAREWPEWRWVLAWKEEGQWCTQIIHA
jgi:hypothetical protein